MTEADFIRAVLARPDDDGPRLVYADWLDEQWRGHRAEFIRVQCAIDEKESWLPEVGAVPQLAPPPPHADHPWYDHVVPVPLAFTEKPR